MTARLLLAALLALVLTACGGTAGGSGSARSTDVVRGDTFEEDVQLAKVYGEQFWKAQFEALGRTYEPVTEFIPYRGEDGPSCGGEPSTPENAFYCPDGHFIAYDRDWLDSFWEKLGDGSTYLIILHEIGHAVQAQQGTEFRLNVERELQADCYAGAALAGLVKANVLNPEEGDDTELMANLEAAGDPSDDWFRPDAHGTAQQRQRAFTNGYANGVGAC
ncbi:neutral zinc metallopeptidase [Nonomuraea sp. NPDC059194]|uniref:neutral zinc metallopeptidase n=1 Tax=Nonomuraea sp. NPDC059194 TaxID=3346764 RepID=UPI0036955BFA